jgi:hypothetical protein
MAGEDRESGKPAKDNAEELSRLLELELMQKRAAWQQANARHKTLKSLSILFLFVVIMAALVAFYLLYGRISEQHGTRPSSTTESPSGH